MPIPCNAESWNAGALNPSRLHTLLPSPFPVLFHSGTALKDYSHREKDKQLTASKLLSNPSTFLNSIFYAEL